MAEDAHDAPMLAELVPLDLGSEVSTEVARLRQEDAERVLKYLAPDMAHNTRRAYKSHLLNFAKWCDTRQVSPLPATETTVIAYLTYACNRPPPDDMRPSSARAVKSAISVMHDSAGHPNPTRGVKLKNALKRLDREFQGGRVRRVDPLVIEDVEQVTTETDPESLEELRAAAIIWAAYGGLLRRSEVVGLDAPDISDYRARLENGETEMRTRLFVARSKTDQTGEGAYVDIPTPAAVAIRAWLRATGITSGPMFRPFNRGNVLPRRLSAQVVALIVKDFTKAAGLNGTYSGHSGRRGGATEAKLNGVSDTELKRAGRWKSFSAMERYINNSANTNPDVRAGVNRRKVG